MRRFWKKGALSFTLHSFPTDTMKYKIWMCDACTRYEYEAIGRYATLGRGEDRSVAGRPIFVLYFKLETHAGKQALLIAVRFWRGAPIMNNIWIRVHKLGR